MDWLRRRVSFAFVFHVSWSMFKLYILVKPINIHSYKLALIYKNIHISINYPFTHHLLPSVFALLQLKVYSPTFTGSTQRVLYVFVLSLPLKWDNLP